MILTIHAARKGEYALSSITDEIDIYEYEKVSFSVKTPDRGRYSLHIGDYSTALSSYEYDNSGLFIYRTTEMQCFKNFVGICPISIRDEEDNILLEFACINVYASKATSERAISFLRYIVKHDDFSTACFSITRGRSDGKHNPSNVTAKIEAGLKVLNHLKNEWGHFLRDPCSKTRIHSRVEPYLPHQPITPEGVEYLVSNPDTLIPSTKGQSVFSFKGRHYQISTHRVNRPEQDTNVEENRYIAYFLANFHRYLTQLDRQMAANASSKAETISVNSQEYLSIDQILKESGVFLNFQQSNIRSGIQKTTEMMRQFEERLGVNAGSLMRITPKLTQQALVKPHYFNAYRLIDRYFSTGEPNWKGETDLYGLRTMPKLYELVLLLSMITEIKKQGFELNNKAFINDIAAPPSQRPINEPNNRFSFVRDSELLYLYYDIPVRAMRALSQNDVLGTPIDIKHGFGSTWRPDFLIIHSDQNSQTRVHILDAKYSTEEITMKDRLPSCAFKYTTCLRVLDFRAGQPILRMPDSMLLLHSEKDSRVRPINEYVRNQAPSFLNLDELAPLVGIAGVTEKADTGMTDVIKQILSNHKHKAA